ncbi:TonB-dependent receptor domain-containing protein [Hyphococcus sp. DH-69]|uniref:TonB-dependent receptor domain-containing protein n=1 Tax=Hyphococcus formosus TaxID=3143534 RepID=UPI00398AAFE1
MRNSIKTKLLLSAAPAFAFMSGVSVAQDAPAADEDVIVVTGTNIRGARINEALPVTVIGADDIAAVGGIDGEDLVAALPAQGATEFRDDNNSTVNNARGDVSSINLRSIGSSGTLVLLNGRRVVAHPGTQAELSTPVVTTNVNALPVSNISRVEVLNDGASAIYGTDAVAGVFNTILDDDYEGLALSVRHGTAEDTELDEQSFRLQAGKTFNDGKTNINFSAEYSRRDGLFASEQDFSASNDLRPFLEGGYFEGDVSFDNRSTRSPWGQFTLNTTSSTRVRQNGEILTTSGGRFHIQPDTLAGCRGTTADDLATDGICIDDSSLNRELRYDAGPVRQIISDRDRFNAFAFLNHDMDNGVRVYGEFGYYYAETDSTLEASTPIASGDIVIPANNYWNPFGPVTFSDGSANPNRLPGLENVPAEGLPVYVDGARYRLVDLGPRHINVKNTSWRALLGAKGQVRQSNWDFDTALLYSRAKTDDMTDGRVSSTLFQQALANETPDAYNMFNGADLTNFSLDSTPNPQSVIDPFMIDVQRLSQTELAVGDFKLTNGGLFQLPGGGVGVALGVEGRYEAYKEDRDDRLDGTITFTDMVTGQEILSDVMGSSPTPDSSGSRTVWAGFVETSIPVISPEMGIPLINTFDIQAAARYEYYSDFGGSGIKPRVAAAWKPVDFIKFRGAWSLGFRAPNLYVVNEEVFRSNTRTDAVFCHAGVENGTFADYSDCEGFTESRQERRTVDPDIGPEDDRNLTYGFVFEPRGLDGALSFLNGLTITMDRWDIQRKRVVGVFGGQNHISLDLVQRLNGSSNPNVVRADPNEDDIAFFAGTGITPVGDILFINDTYDNNENIDVAGTDFALYYSFGGSAVGDFDIKFNATKLREFFVSLSPGSIAIADAIDSGQISNEIDVAQEGDIILENGQPKWRLGANLTWRHDSGLGMGARVNYIGRFIDTGAGLNPDDEPFIVTPWVTTNLYAQYELEDAGVLSDTRFRFGVNNIFDKEPPLADERNGYDASYHSARGRYLYIDVRKSF